MDNDVLIDVEGEFVLNKPLAADVAKEIKALKDNDWIYSNDPNGHPTISFSEDHNVCNMEDALVHIVKTILQPRGYVLNGTTTWSAGCEGEDISIYNNVIINPSIVINC